MFCDFFDSKPSLNNKNFFTNKLTSCKNNKMLNITKINENNIVDAKPLTKLPPLVNINSMMNTDVKQTKQIWNTNFGKKLINGKNLEENNKETAKPKLLNFNKVKKYVKAKNVDIGRINFLHIKRLVHGKNTKIEAGDNGFKLRKKAFCTIKKISSNWNETFQNSEKISKNSDEMVDFDSSRDVENYSKSSLHKNSKTFLDNSQEKIETHTVSSLVENQHFLTGWVKNILDKVSSTVICEHCNETLANSEKLMDHKKKHEEEKQCCLLCGKIFFSGSSFIQHLLFHEGIDKLTCKKCKIYFPSLKKYKKHYDDIHFIPSYLPLIKNEEKRKLNRWFPKNECRRCKEVFDSDEAFVNHRRNHIKMDLMGAYLLNYKNL